MLRTADELRAELLAKKVKREQEALQKEELVKASRAAVADLVFLGLSFKEILQRTSIAPETLATIFKETRLPYRMPSQIFESPREVSPSPIAASKPPRKKFGADRWSNAMVVDLSESETDSEDEGDTYLKHKPVINERDAMEVDAVIQDVTSTPVPEGTPGDEPFSPNSLASSEATVQKAAEESLSIEEQIKEMEQKIRALKQKSASQTRLTAINQRRADISERKRMLLARMEPRRLLRVQAERLKAKLNELRDSIQSIEQSLETTRADDDASQKEMKALEAEEKQLNTEEEYLLTGGSGSDSSTNPQKDTDDAMSDMVGESVPKAQKVDENNTKRGVLVSEPSQMDVENVEYKDTALTTPEADESEDKISVADKSLSIPQMESSEEPYEKVGIVTTEAVETKSPAQPNDGGNSGDSNYGGQSSEQKTLELTSTELEAHPAPETAKASKPSDKYTYESPLHIFSSHRFSPLADIFAPMYNSRYVTSDGYFCRTEASGRPCRNYQCADVHSSSFDLTKNQVIKNLTQAVVGNPSKFSRGLVTKIHELEQISSEFDPHEVARLIRNYRAGLDPGRFLDWRELEASGK